MELLNGRLKLRHLVVVVAVADQGGVLRAAERLRLAQPAVTRCLRELEHILGVQLFVRGPRGVTPTPSGEAFLEHARAVLAELRRAGERVSGLAAGALGTVRVGTLPAGSSVLLPCRRTPKGAHRWGSTSRSATRSPGPPPTAPGSWAWSPRSAR
ncbi:hypothetical protein DMB42_13975 [Nonomuraea sp. WAC 01424]|nr:hypothetical protein DMB42_13975 [Nonomuraea sp. WAC 01424]